MSLTVFKVVFELLLLSLVVDCSTLSTFSSRSESCLEITLNSQLSLATQTLILDDVVGIYHKLNEQLKSRQELVIDLSCLEHLTHIAHTNAKFIELTQFTATRTNPNSLIVEYLLKSDNSTKFTAKILIANAENIKSLVLNNNRLLVQTPPASLTLLGGLTHLNLASNRIGPDPVIKGFGQSSFKGLVLLRHLDLSNNPLDFAIEPGTFKHTPGLLDLKMASSKAASRLTPGSLDGLDLLESLNLSTYSDVVSIQSESFRSLPNLKILDLSGMNVMHEPELIFQHLGNLTRLVLVDFKFGSLRSSLPTDAFNFSNRLEALDFSHRLDGTYEKSLGSFRGLGSLKRLSLRRRSLMSSYAESSFSTFKTLERNMFESGLSLTHLDLAENFYDADVFNDVAFLNASLETLNLDANKLELLDAPTNISLLAGLRELYLNKNWEIRLNVSHFAGLGRLKVLDLAFNKIDRLTTRSFVGLQRLEHLDLADNFIRTIENGTFLPLASALSVDLRRNPIRNLFFFGLSHDCSIHLDGLSVFNISLIDFSQMVSGRKRSFLQKTLHLRHSRAVTVYRNIQVGWKSVSAAPNCSLYFHVLRTYRVISFDIDDAYIEQCLTEDLALVSRSFEPPEFSTIARMTTWSLLRALPPDVEFYGSTSDGLLVGLSQTGDQIVTLNLVQSAEMLHFNASKHLFGDRLTKLIIISDHLLVGIRNGLAALTLWNLTDRSNITFVRQLPIARIPIALTRVFQLTERHVATFEIGNNSLCFIDVLSAASSFECQMLALQSGAAQVFEAVVVGNDSIIFGINFIGLEILNWRKLLAKEQAIVKVLDTGDLKRFDMLFSFNRPLHSYVIGQTRDSVFGVWSLERNETLLLMQTIRYRRFDVFEVSMLRSSRRSDVLVAFRTWGAVDLWSLRYGKKVERIETNSFSSRMFALFEQGILVTDDHAYQF